MADSASKDVSALDGSRITSEAASWNGTPYALVGMLSEKGQGGDCSGTTYKIFQAVGLPYEYRTAGDFPAYAVESGLFRELKNGEARQDGDVLSWSHHVAVYSTFSTSAEASSATTQRTGSHGTWTQVNDMWTAHHSGGDPYSPAALKYWGGPPRVFRRTQAR
jgi:cell wall-associated NlpC family hydrolase